MATIATKPLNIDTFIDRASPVVVEPVEPVDVLFVPVDPVEVVLLEVLATAGLL